MLHRILLTLHSGLRWVVLTMLVVVLVHAIRSWRQSAERTKRDRILVASTVGLADLQLLLGLSLYVVGPWLTTLGEDMGLVMRTAPLRFFVVEHAFGMIVGLVILHVASVRSRKADDDRTGWRRLAIGVGVALFAILASIPWPFMAYGRPLLRLG